MVHGKVFLLWLVIALSFACNASGYPVLKSRNTLKCGIRGEHDMSALVVSEGYPLQPHTAVTEDGFKLTLFRIPTHRMHAEFGGSDEANGKKGRKKKPVVLLQHGLLDSSAAWVINGRERSLAFMLADAGFDVWMGNSRGNTFSRQHEWLDDCDDQFWAFTFDEMAKFDLPATINYILDTTGVRQLAYVGHSQGSTIAFAKLSADSELAGKVSVAVMLAPVAYVRHMSSGLIRVLAHFNTAQLFALLGVDEFLPSLSLVSYLLGGMCHINPTSCDTVLGAICGYNPDNLDESRWNLYLHYTPAGSSTQNIIHWAQAVQLDDEPILQKFDFGDTCKTFIWGRDRKCNKNMYGQENPPKYDISKFNVPVALFTGGKDKLSDEADRKLLLDVLPKEKLLFDHFEPGYEHLDFTWGIDAHEKIYPKLIQVLKGIDLQF